MDWPHKTGVIAVPVFIEFTLYSIGWFFGRRENIKKCVLDDKLKLS